MHVLNIYLFNLIMVNEVLLKNICGWIGAVLLSFFFLSPIVPIVKVIKKITLLKDLPGWLYLSSLLNSLFWAAYSVYISELSSIVPNILGIVVLTVLMTIYWIYYSEFVLLKYLIINGVMYVVIAIIISICYVISFQEYKDVIGYIAAGISILMFASPGQKLIEVFKTENYELIAIASSVCGFFCCGFWLIFGILIMNTSIMVSNGCGFLFATTQFIIYFFFRFKGKRNKNIKTSSELMIYDDKEDN